MDLWGDITYPNYNKIPYIHLSVVNYDSPQLQVPQGEIQPIITQNYSGKKLLLY
jgi:hypothetical protein